jgi:hypothetical protein
MINPDQVKPKTATCTSIIPKKKIKFYHKCPICQKKIDIQVEKNRLDNVSKYPFPHIVIHGHPIHAIIVYVDKNLQIRGWEQAESIQFSRDSRTFGQILKKWSNPF